MLRIPPQDVESEKEILGAIMLDGSAILLVLQILQPEYFYSAANGTIFTAVLNLHNAGTPVDIITLREQLRKVGELEHVGGSAYLSELVQRVVSSANIEAHCQIVAEKYILRATIDRNSKIIEACYEDYDSAFELAADSQASTSELLTKLKYSVLSRPQDRVDTVANQLEHGTWHNTGFVDLDNYVQIRPQTVVTVAARPRVGKSLFALNVADYLSLQFPVLYFSLEMSELGMHVRIMSNASGYSVNDLLRNRRVDWSDVKEKTMKHLANRKLDFNFTSSLTAQEIRLAVLSYKSTHPNLALVIIDYMQLIRPAKKEHFSREQEVAEIMRGLIQTAKDCDVCVMPLAQLSRAAEVRADKAPQLSDLRESGSLEQDSDVVILLHRPALYGLNTLYDGRTDSENKIEVRIAKNRNGHGGIVVLGFNGEKMRMESQIHEENENVRRELENWKPKHETEELPF